MPRPTTRVLALLELLQAGGTRTVADLAGRLGVDERTVRRYVTHLTDLDVPVESIRGRYGGYRLARGYRLPPLMFTDDEVIAVALGLVTARRLGLAPVAVESAAAKVQRVLPRTLANRLRALVKSVAVTDVGTADSSAVLLSLAVAAESNQLVIFDYVDRHDRQSERNVAPYGLVAHSGRWYLTGHDTERGEVRSFRLDRISDVRCLPRHFEAPVDFDPTESVLTALAATPWRHQVSVLVQGEPTEMRATLRRRLAEITATDQPGWVRVEFRAERLDWVPGVLIGLNRSFRVERPAALRDLLHQVATRASRAADG